MQSPAVAATDAMQFISDVAADLFQAKTSSRPPPLRRSLSPVSEDLSVEELVQQCDVILTKLKGADASENIQQPTLPGGVRGAGALGLDVSTLGRGVIVRDMVPGGPAHCSKKLGRGDVIVAVDGVPVTPENWSRLAAGNGKPGSIATLTILKTESTGDIAPTAYKTLAAEVAKVAQVEVKLRRMARSDMSDNEIMFKLFDDATQELALSSAASARGRHAGRPKWLRDSWLPDAKENGVADRIDCVADRIESCISHWTQKLERDMEREYATAQKVYEMQEEAAEMVKDLQHALSKMSLVPKKQLHYIRSESDANESERAATLQELKEAKRELIYLQSEMQGIRAVNKKLRDHSAITNEELTKVQKEVLKLRQEKEDMCLQILKYESGGDERDTAAENIAELKTRLEKADVAMQKAFADLAAAQKGSADAEKLKEAERFNAELQDKLKSSEAEKQRVLTRLVVAQKEIDLLQEEDQTFTEREKEQYEAKRSRLITVIENQQVEIAKLQRELSAKRKEMTELRQELRDSGCAQQMLLHERKSWDEAHRELQLIIKMTKAELQDTKQDLAQAEGQKSKLQQELEAARVDIAGAEAKIDGLEQVLTNRNRDVMVLKKKLEVALTHSQAVAWEMKKHVEFQNLESKTNELASLQSQMQQEANTLLETQAALQEANRAYILTERLLVTERQTWLQANTELQNVINDLCAELNARTVELSQVRGQSGRKEIVRYVINPSASADLVLASNTSSAQRMRKVGSPFQLLETVQCV